MLRLACALAQRAKRGEERQSTASGPFSADQVVATEANRCDTSSTQQEPSDPCLSRQRRAPEPVQMPKAGAWNLGKKSQPIWGATSRRSGGGRSARDCPFTASTTADSVRSTPTQRNWMLGGTNGRPQAQPMLQMRALFQRSSEVGSERVQRRLSRRWP